MPTAPTYPGVYIEEVPSGVRTITGVATSITAFVGPASRGLANAPVTINSFGDFERLFGGLSADSMLSYAVRDFYQNGGSQAIIVRIHNGASAATIELPTGAAGPNDGLTLVAASEGSWGNNLRAAVDYNTKNEGADTDLFNLTVFETIGGDNVKTEKFLNVSLVSTSPRYLPRVLEQQSLLVRVLADSGGPVIPVDSSSDPVRPLETIEMLSPPSSPPQGKSVPVEAAAGSGTDGSAPAPTQYIGSKDLKTGIFALEKADLFNLLCVPPPARGGNTDKSVWSAAMTYCVERRAMLLVDSDAEWGLLPETAVSNAIKGLGDLGLSGTAARNAALYFPRVVESDLLLEQRPGYVRAVRDNRRRDGPDGLTTRRVEGAGRSRCRPQRRSRPAGQCDRSGERTAESSGHQLSAVIPRQRARRVGRADAARRGSTGGRIQVRAGAPHGAVPRREPVSRDAVGGVRAERRAAVGADPPQYRRLHAEPLPSGGVPGQDADERRTW